MPMDLKQVLATIDLTRYPQGRIDQEFDPVAKVIRVVLTTVMPENEKATSLQG